MTTKILAHNGGTRQYKAILRHLGMKHQIVSHNLHNRLFDMCYVSKPNILLYPVVEYTQEIHNYVESHQNKHRIIFYIDTIIDNPQLCQYLLSGSCGFITNKRINSEFVTKNAISFEYLYDDQIYYRLENLERNNKIAVALSSDAKGDYEILKDMLYPNPSNMVLFNNPEFQHPQNVGVYNEPDLNYLLNLFSYFLDMSQDFALEAAATGIKWCGEPGTFKHRITDINYHNTFDDSYQQYKCSTFVSEQLIPYLGI